MGLLCCVERRRVSGWEQGGSRIWGTRGWEVGAEGNSVIISEILSSID